MNIEVYASFENVPLKEAVVRYRFNPDEVANRKESDEINLTRVDYISSDEEGVHDIGIPTCSRNFLAEPATDLDREVYRKMVDEGILVANVAGLDIDWFIGCSDNIPLVNFECAVWGSAGVIAGTINPFSPTDTPTLPMFIWEAAVAKARDVVRRFDELMAVGE